MGHNTEAIEIYGRIDRSRSLAHTLLGTLDEMESWVGSHEDNLAPDRVGVYSIATWNEIIRELGLHYNVSYQTFQEIISATVAKEAAAERAANHEDGGRTPIPFQKDIDDIFSRKHPPDDEPV